MSEELRARLYASYVSGGQARAPASIGELESRAPYLRRLVSRHFPPERDASVLDLGCGSGALLHVAREAGFRRLRGVDTSAEQVDAAARLGIAGVEQGDLLEVVAALAEASEDVIVAFDVMEHLEKGQLLRFVDGAHRALKPGGRLLVHVPNAESPFFGAVRYGDLTHELAFTGESLSQLLRAAGFREVRCFEDQPVVHGVRSAVRLVLWKAIRTLLRLAVAAETGSAGRGAIFTRNLLAVAVR